MGHAYAYRQCVQAWNGQGQYAKNWHGTTPDGPGAETTLLDNAQTAPATDNYCTGNSWDCVYGSSSGAPQTSDYTSLLPIDPTQNPQNSTPATQQGGPNWGKIAAGVGIILAVDLLIVAPIVIGVALSPEIFVPEEIAAMSLTETGWVTAMSAAVITTNVLAWNNLIVAGWEGK